jgi:chromosomal replication initiation ATPase DnaA
MITVAAIQKNVAASFRIPLAKMTEPMNLGTGKDGRNSREFSVPRQLAMYLAREFVSTPRKTPEMGRQPISYPTLARLFGRDHTTVIFAVRAVEKRMAKDRDFRRKVKEIRYFLALQYPVDRSHFLICDREVESA